MMSFLKSKLGRNAFLIVFGIVGFILIDQLAPPVETSIVIPERKERAGNASLPLPPIGPRKTGFNPFVQSFLFQLGDTAKMTGLAREEILQAQYYEVLTGLHGELPSVEVKDMMGMTVVTIDGTPFATVLPSDAPDYYQRLDDPQKKQLEHEIAEQWRMLLEEDLAIETSERSPQYVAAFPYRLGIFICIALILHALADMFSRRFLRSPGWSIKAFFWLSCISLATFQHPFFKPIALALIEGGLAPVFYFLVIVSCCNVVYGIGSRILDNYVAAYAKHRDSNEGRLEKRLNTMVEGGRFLIATVVTVGGVVWFLGAIGIEIRDVFAGAGIAGIALGVVGKDILIDYFYGINILADDQFNIGDFIETPVATGTVESFNLRTTRIREADGGLSIVTNGRFTVIKNHSRDFANSDFRIGVAYGSDTDHCLELMCDEIRILAEERPGQLEAEPVVRGIHELSESAVVLRTMVRTAALSQWGIKRELNRRVLHRFEKEGIDIPFPTQKVWLHQAADAR
jgi:small-conductance mechanosensitive channel